MKQNQRKRIARILCANKLRKRHRHFLGRREAVFSVEDHAVRTIEHHDCRARRLIFALMYLKIGIFNVERQFQTIALNSRRQSSGDVEVEHIAKLILLGCSTALNSCRQVARIVPAKTRTPQGTKKVSQSFVAEEIQALVRDLKTDVRL